MPGPVDYREALAALFGIPPDSVIVDGLVARLTPTISTEALFTREQEDYRAMQGACDVTGVAGGFATAQLWNSAGSGVLLILERVLVINGSAPASDYIDSDFSATALTTLTHRGEPRDRRDTGSGAGQVREESAAGALINPRQIYRVISDETISLPIDGRVILPEGQGIVFANRTANLTLVANFWWREYAV